VNFLGFLDLSGPVPDFGRNRHLMSFEVRVFFADCVYDIILGCDILRHFRLTLDFDKDRTLSPASPASQPPWLKS
jgi:hypothetical protein